MNVVETLRPPKPATRLLSLERDDLLRRGALGVVALIAAALRFANLQMLGYVNHYYSAAVVAMLRSPGNFFFVAAEPGGAVSVDKPPVGLWIEAISGYFFGVNTFGLLLPQMLSGVLSAILVYHLVRRTFGTAAGLVAALALAITPVAVATDRNNTIDSMLILCLLLTAWAFLKAAETARLRWLMTGAVLTGVAFNIKMLEAFLPLPAFAALYFFGAPARWWTKLGQLFLAGVVILAVSLSWPVAVDLTPPDQRPYVGSSADNSELNLIVGFNGLQRLLGRGGQSSPLTTLLNGNQTQGPGRGGSPGGFGPFGQRPGNTNPFAPVTNIGGTGGMSFTGQPGLFRLAIPPLSNQLGWLLPVGVFGAVLLVFRARPRWPIARKHQSLILWGGWLAAGIAFFNVAGFFHEYYLAIIAAPLAALAGIGAGELWNIRERHPWIAANLLLPIAGTTLWYQLVNAGAFLASPWWAPLAVGLLTGGAVLVLGGISRTWREAALPGYAAVVAAVLLTPGIWAGLTTAYASENQSLPSAYTGRPSNPPDNGGLMVDSGLLDYIEPRTAGFEYLMAVPSAMQGSDYVIATGRPVLYLGGFLGQDKVVDAQSLAGMVAAGRLRFIYWDARNAGGRGGNNDPQGISTWVSRNCLLVPGYDASTQNAGAPRGTSRTAGGGNLRISLYDCAAP